MGKKVKEKINEKGVRMNWVAEKLDMSYSCFSHRICGHTPFSYSEIIKISNILNINENDLLS